MALVKKHEALREKRIKTVKSVKACPKCEGFMVPVSQFIMEGDLRGYVGPNQVRSFGGLEVKTYECERCHHTGQFQHDPFGLDEE